MSCRKRPSLPFMTVARIGTVLAALLCLFASAASVAHATQKTAVSLSPHLTELIYAAGAGEHLLGVAQDSNYPPAAARLPQVGSGVRPNVERIAVLRPDVILAWGYKSSQHLYPALRKLDIPMHYQAPASLDAIINDIEELGALFGTQAAARATTQQLRKVVRTTRQRYQNAARIKTFVMISQEPLYTLGANSFVIDALHACGAVSAFETLTTPAPVVSREQLLFAQPQAVLFAANDGVANNDNHNDKIKDSDSSEHNKNQIGRYFAAMDLALQHDQLIGMNPDIVFRPTDRLIRSLPALCSKIDRIRRRLAPAASESPLPPPRHLP
ncbi:hypothetical protein CAP48_18920 [Advenella sp. S44]|uniref:helical backbone metal receptor n=1 Tax=Advenella sp. S44 TaxID=1982755 RepID=UPI000C2A4860|nr:helical backbone metal receptor [Advenella sp. S44]PJX20474.1 hypothetical protein CAP48_18920 [Advenella sp. S44]